MPLHHPLRRSHDHGSIGWISNTDAVMFGMVVCFVVAVFMEKKAVLAEKTNPPEGPRTLGQMENDLEEAQRKLESAQAALAKLKQEAAAAAESITKLASERDELKAARDELKAAVDKLRRANDELGRTNADLVKSVESLEGRLQKGMEAYKNLREEHQKLLAEHKAEVQSHNADRQMLAALREEVKNLLEQVRMANEENGVVWAAYIEGAEQFRRMKADEGRVRRELLGLKGKDNKLGRVAIIFDASLSMEQSGRWDAARAVMEDWLQYLDIDAGALVVFSTNVKTFPEDGTLLRFDGPAGANRDELCRFLAKQKPEGGTNTLAALERAYRYPNLDAILLFTDGAPNDGHGASFDPVVAKRIYKLCEEHRDIPINAVGLGDYFKPELSRFLLEVKKITNGTFMGR